MSRTASTPSAARARGLGGQALAVGDRFGLGRGEVVVVARRGAAQHAGTPGDGDLRGERRPRRTAPWISRVSSFVTSSARTAAAGSN